MKKTHCLDIVSQLLPDLGAEKLEIVKDNLKKLSDNAEASKAYTDGVLKDELAQAEKKSKIT